VGSWDEALWSDHERNWSLRDDSSCHVHRELQVSIHGEGQLTTFSIDSLKGRDEFMTGTAIGEFHGGDLAYEFCGGGGRTSAWSGTVSICSWTGRAAVGHMTETGHFSEK
jgi:hypothetical protein